jgi:hypothetical protein
MSSTKTAQLLLVGEQPVPNLLSILHRKPDDVLLAYTDRTKTQATNLRSVIGGDIAKDVNVPSYDIGEIRQQLQSRLAALKNDGFDLEVNLTGGTKPMSLASYDLAQRFGAPFLYLQTEGRKTLFYRYTQIGDGYTSMPAEEVSELLTLDSYFRVHGFEYTAGSFGTGPGEWFERAVVEALRQEGYEVLTGVKFTQFGKQLDIDAAIRYRNQVGVIECKLDPNKKGIDQLNTAGGREFLGTYVSKFLICNRTMDTNKDRQDLRELARARAIETIELDESKAKMLTPGDIQKLLVAVACRMGK